MIAKETYVCLQQLIVCDCKKKTDNFLMQIMLICGFAKKHVWLKKILVSHCTSV
jgi:hypothetical protein